MGEGFPGILAASGEPLLSKDLRADDRFLRRHAVRKGYTGFAGVPVWGRGLAGSLHLVFRRGDVDLPAKEAALTGVAGHLGLAIELQRLRVADGVRALSVDPLRSPRANFEATATAVLDALIAGAGASGGMLLMAEGDDGAAYTIVAERDLNPGARRAVSGGIPAIACPAWVDGSCISQGEEEPYASPACRAVARGVTSIACLPLVPKVSGRDPAAPARRPAAVAVLCYDRHLPFPSAHMAFLHDALAAAGDVLASARYLLTAAGAPNREAMVQTSPTVWSGIDAAATAQRSGRVALDIRCLGAFRLALGTAVIPPEAFRRRHALAILKALLVRDDRAIHRDELLALLWPETPPEKARHLLATAMHSLRRALVGQGGEPLELVRRVGDFYEFDRAVPHTLDLRDFRHMAATGDRLAKRDRAEEALVAYRRAAALYAGPLYQDDPASEWCEPARAHFHDLHIGVLRGAAQICLDAGDLEAAIDCYRTALRSDHALEDLHVALMRALARAGRRIEAIRQFRELCAILEREFDTIPLPETRRLYDEISLEA
ncbi:MAG: winged helix-turn-helix domain-containing protein [Candidatus Sericytochromatia bacterium]|nr:winged helix-turn-helix domain-containing protein [Candidatus Tanganyikabacteria bacterium]